MADTQDNLAAAGDSKGPEDINNDGGILKEIIKEGEGFEKPINGSEVKVHYVGTLLDGTKFDSSRDRGTLFEFPLGQGRVIKGWDQGVATMKRGEIAKFTLAPEYAYGENGSPPKIPKNATLVFEVELVDFSNERDLSNDGGVMKKTLVEGSKEAYQTPKFETKCKLNLKLECNDKVIEEKENYEVIIGDEQVVRGVEVGLESMKQGEKAILTIQPSYGYGDAGDEALGIPAGATLTYTIELVEFTREKEAWEMKEFSDKMEAAMKRRLQGNELYKQKKFARALKKYEVAVKFFQYDNDLKDEEKAEAKEKIKVPCNNNMAAVFMRQKDHAKVLEHCKKVLEQDENNIKALYRRGQTYIAVDKWNDARADLRAALKLDPDNKEVKRALARLQQRINQQKKKDKKTFANLFSRLDKMEKKEKPAAAPAEEPKADPMEVEKEEDKEEEAKA